MIEIDETEREKWWQIWRKGHKEQDNQITQLAFTAGWNSGAKFNNGDVKPKSQYDRMIELLAEMEIGFAAHANRDLSYPLPYSSEMAISIEPKHDKVDMVGICHVTFYFDKNGKFVKLLGEE